MAPMKLPVTTSRIPAPLVDKSSTSRRQRSYPRSPMPSARCVCEIPKNNSAKKEVVKKTSLVTKDFFHRTINKEIQSHLRGSTSMLNLFRQAPIKDTKAATRKVNSNFVSGNKPNPTNVQKVISKLQQQIANSSKNTTVAQTLEPPYEWKLHMVRGVKMNKTAKLRMEMNFVKLNGWGKPKPLTDKMAWSCVTLHKY